MEGPERIVCCTLCMCMAVAVFSSVALVYLTALVYVPAKREIQSGLSHVPAMCTTIERLETDDCDWYSCGEWCLSKSSHCVKLWAQVRKNGTDVLLQQCTNHDVASAAAAAILRNTQRQSSVDISPFLSVLVTDHLPSNILAFKSSKPHSGPRMRKGA